MDIVEARGVGESHLCAGKPLGMTPPPLAMGRAVCSGDRFGGDDIDDTQSIGGELVRARGLVARRVLV